MDATKDGGEWYILSRVTQGINEVDTT